MQQFLKERKRRRKVVFNVSQIYLKRITIDELIYTLLSSLTRHKVINLIHKVLLCFSKYQFVLNMVTLDPVLSIFSCHTIFCSSTVQSLSSLHVNVCLW